MRNLLKSTFQYSDYQIAQLEYFFKTLLSELSKLIIMGILFRSKLFEYFAAIIMMTILRSLSGGLHCRTYLSCLAVSVTYVYSCLYILSPIQPTKWLMSVVLTLCILIIYFIGPVTSNVHQPLSPDRVKVVRTQILLFTFIFWIVAWIIPENRYVTIGFWIMILHTVQLIIAKILKQRRLTR